MTQDNWTAAALAALFMALGAVLVEIAKRLLTSPDRVRQEALEMLAVGSAWRRELEGEVASLRAQVDELQVENAQQREQIAMMQNTITRLERLACIVNCDDRRGLGE